MCTVSLLTLTGDSSIFKMRTVMNTKWVARTIHQSGLSPSTAHLIQKNGSSSTAKVGKWSGNCTCGEKNLLSEETSLLRNRHIVYSSVSHAEIIYYNDTYSSLLSTTRNQSYPLTIISCVGFSNKSVPLPIYYFKVCLNQYADAVVYVYTCWCKSKLSAGHISISSPPGIITHSAPCIVVADFHSTFITVCTTSKPDVSISTWCCSKIVTRDCGK